MDTLGTIPNQTIPAGDTISPEVAVPSGYNFAEARLTRNNWPGVVRFILERKDGGVWRYAMEANIAQWVSTPKQPTVVDAAIGFGWSVKPDAVRVRVQNGFGSFTSTITVRAG